jgi:hypothetical protein
MIERTLPSARVMTKPRNSGRRQPCMTPAVFGLEPDGKHWEPARPALPLAAWMTPQPMSGRAKRTADRARGCCS